MPLLNRREAWKPLDQPEGLQPDEEVREWSGSLRSAATGRRPPPLSIAICGDGSDASAAGARGRARSPPSAHPAANATTAPLPAALPPLPQVWHIESTGEVFRSYEAYLQRVELYKQGVWSCKYTGKGGLTFEDAQAAEAKAVKQLDSVRHQPGAPAAPTPAQLLSGAFFYP